MCPSFPICPNLFLCFPLSCFTVHRLSFPCILRSLLHNLVSSPVLILHYLFLRMQKIVSVMSFVHLKSSPAFTTLLLRMLQERRYFFPTYKGMVRSDRSKPALIFFRCKSTHNKIHCQNSSC
jgi:hypothetical protein